MTVHNTVYKSPYVNEQGNVSSNNYVDPQYRYGYPDYAAPPPTYNYGGGTSLMPNNGQPPDYGYPYSNGIPMPPNLPPNGHGTIDGIPFSPYNNPYTSPGTQNFNINQPHEQAPYFANNFPSSSFSDGPPQAQQTLQPTQNPEINPELTQSLLLNHFLGPYFPLFKGYPTLSALHIAKIQSYNYILGFISLIIYAAIIIATIYVIIHFLIIDFILNAKVFGVPGVSVASKAFGIIAIGQRSIGLISIGQLSFGFISIGQIAVGGFVLGMAGASLFSTLGIVSSSLCYSYGLISFGFIVPYCLVGIALFHLHSALIGFQIIYPIFVWKDWKTKKPLPTTPNSNFLVVIGRTRRRHYRRGNIQITLSS